MATRGKLENETGGALAAVLITGREDRDSHDFFTAEAPPLLAFDFIFTLSFALLTPSTCCRAADKPVTFAILSFSSPTSRKIDLLGLLFSRVFFSLVFLEPSRKRSDVKVEEKLGRLPPPEVKRCPPENDLSVDELMMGVIVQSSKPTRLPN